MLQNSSIVATVGLAILTGLTIVAYRHPEAFGKIACALTLVAFAFMLGTIAFNLGTLAAIDAVSAAKDLESVNTRVDQVIRDAEVPQ